jgi:hypothetical protein
MPKYTIATLSQIDNSGENYLLYGTRPEEYEMAILGVGETPLGSVVVYDEETLIELEEAAFAASCEADDHEDCDHWTEAVEFVGPGNQPWIGPRSYMIIQRFCEEHEMQTVACPCPLSMFDRWGKERIAEAAKRAAAAADSGKAA